MLIRREFSLDHCKGGITLIATNDFLLRGGLPFPQRMIQASNGIHDMSPSQADPQGRRLAIQQIPTISERGSTYVCTVWAPGSRCHRCCTGISNPRFLAAVMTHLSTLNGRKRRESIIVSLPPSSPA